MSTRLALLVPSMRATFDTMWWLLVLAGPSGCAGAAFEGGDPAGFDAYASTPAADDPIAPSPDSGAAADSGTLTPCGGARGGDAPRFTREVCVTGAAFTMGSSVQNLGGSFADHTPALAVTLSNHFLDAYEVTVGRYRACVEAGACVAPVVASGVSCAYTIASGASEALPVNCVTWEQSRLFCKWDGRKLPTEAEWEFAVRGTNDRSYPWGSDKTCDRAVLARYSGGPCAGISGPMVVGSMLSGASPEGIFDLAGNAAEWVSDWAGSYSSTVQVDPPGPVGGAVKILRGGSWDNAWSAGLAYARMSMDPTAKGSWGFRCARDAE